MPVKKEVLKLSSLHAPDAQDEAWVGLTEDRIERHYYRLILNGEIPPGTRLPSNRELAASWGTSCSTIQKALNKMVAAGLVERTPRRGTFVRHKSSRAFVGILLGPSLIDESASHYRLLNSALSRQLDSEFLSCRTYDNLGTKNPAELDAVIARLKMDQKSFDFRGFVCIAAVPDAVPIDELIPQDTPRAVLDLYQPDNDILFDAHDFGVEIANAVYNQGARHICWFSYSKSHIDAFRAIKDEAQRRGLPAPTLNTLKAPCQSEFERTAYRDALALIEAEKGKGRLPDAIILPDDIVARGFVFALLKLGLRVPEDIKLAVLGNEGSRIYYSVPVVRYNYPIEAVGSELAGMLKLRMANKKVSDTPIVVKGAIAEITHSEMVC